MLGRLIIWFLLGFIIYTIVKAALQTVRGPAGRTPPPEKSRGGEAMERDPRCGTFVPRGDAVKGTVGGEPYWFCSTRCRDEYMKQKQ